jgi:hypothetical protein
MADQSIAPAQTVQEILEQLNLHKNELGSVIICRTCQFALSGSVKSIVDYVVDKHKYSRDLAKDIAKDLGQTPRLYTILELKGLRLQLDSCSSLSISL